MNELTIQGTRSQRNLLEWSEKVALCRSSGLSVTRWCEENGINPKTYYGWQKKVFSAMIEQQKKQESENVPSPERRFAEVSVPKNEHDLVAAIRIGKASLEVYSGASAEIISALCKALKNAK